MALGSRMDNIIHWNVMNDTKRVKYDTQWTPKNFLLRIKTKNFKLNFPFSYDMKTRLIQIHNISRIYEISKPKRGSKQWTSIAFKLMKDPDLKEPLVQKSNAKSP